MGISRASFHKRAATGGKRKANRKKRKHELGRPAANTKLCQSGQEKRVRPVRCRGGNLKRRALRLDTGNFSWGSESTTRKARIVDVVYNASNNELVRTKTLVKNAIIEVDAVPFRTWYEQHYAIPLGRKKGAKLDEAVDEVINKARGVAATKKIAERKKTAPVEHTLEEQFQRGRLLACISSRPGQVGRCDGYVLEGKELEFYQKKLRAKKSK